MARSVSNLLESWKTGKKKAAPNFDKLNLSEEGLTWAKAELEKLLSQQSKANTDLKQKLITHLTHRS
ncbi:hypothetical protein AVI51_03770 [Piscirickettsia salmonis]|uniref:hypothetical protein n=1 Tax=Piscirickettsia salmonis TaxID=1238 RepID=UPI00031385E2|nr:hypothetical protein [Piscirickettsia salmonis]WGZ71036.1 hypothetical protein E3220_04850 [Piscirickettsia salmonis EM-90]APS45459.1 hypothetical protein AVI48_14495 [Piscirickettsia salmonis]APS48820.1 hypothetical protein AVI49_15110 [Piscirickettsia salmonis]APS50055.1 hypothetical protein AVI50_03810 [Piscirickettsia salmonis]APS53254.1 hypothetical protein AVI51_03770 [Piscirickettsia salmonis]